VNSGLASPSRSSAEIAEAIRTLTPVDCVRLRKVAQRYAFGRPIEPEDLLQEAYMRALDGRHSPTNVDVVKFLAEAMRSIAHGEAEKAENKLTLVPIAGDHESQVLSHPDPTPNAEEGLVVEQNAAIIRRSLLALFSDDARARDIVEGTLEDLTAEELRELTGLDETSYASKRRLIRRKIDKAYPNGWKP
jgi:DNA-directed RNA polymerase specialized sigma24 family protein